MGQFATGVTLVTTRHGDHLHGMTANSFTSVSLEPLQVLVCVDKSNNTYQILSQSRAFAVNFLAQEQGHLSRQFASEMKEIHRLDDIPHRFAVTGAPIIEGCLAYLDCRVAAVYPGGDHDIFLGQVEEGAVARDDAPLIFFRGQYRRLA
jgi:flavin reductase (DIM6/NTAB) family NADH-FMN oxidoreductase RutF